jgi:hypothetical protein
MRPGKLDVEKPPLAGLLEVIEVWNRILHYNLRPNIEEVIVPMKSTYERDHGLLLRRGQGAPAGAAYCNPDPFGLIAALIKLASEAEGRALSA